MNGFLPSSLAAILRLLRYCFSSPWPLSALRPALCLFCVFEYSLPQCYPVQCNSHLLISTLGFFPELGFLTASQSTHLLCVNRQLSSVQVSRPVMSDSLRPHKLQHARPPCPSPTPGVHSNSCPLSWWCHPSHLILCHPLLLLSPIPPNIRVFSIESTLHMRWPKYWSFSFSISPSSEHPGLISWVGCN